MSEKIVIRTFEKNEHESNSIERLPADSTPLILKGRWRRHRPPILESVARAATPEAPKRMVFISSALGMNPEAFSPKSFEKDYALSPTLKSLSPLRNDFTVISHMDHPEIYTKHSAMNSLLSGVDAKKAATGQNVSVDQVTRQATHPTLLHIFLAISAMFLSANWATGQAVEPDPVPWNVPRVQVRHPNLSQMTLTSPPTGSYTAFPSNPASPWVMTLASGKGQHLAWNMITGETRSFQLANCLAISNDGSKAIFRDQNEADGETFGIVDSSGRTIVQIPVPTAARSGNYFTCFDLNDQLVFVVKSPTQIWVGRANSKTNQWDEIYKVSFPFNPQYKHLSTNDTESIAIAPDGSFVCVVIRDRLVAVDLMLGKCCGMSNIDAFKDVIYASQISNNGETLALLFGKHVSDVPDTVLKVFDLRNGSLLTSCEMKGFKTDLSIRAPIENRRFVALQSTDEGWVVDLRYLVPCEPNARSQSSDLFLKYDGVIGNDAVIRSGGFLQTVMARGGYFLIWCSLDQATQLPDAIQKKQEQVRTGILEKQSQEHGVALNAKGEVDNSYRPESGENIVPLATLNTTLDAGTSLVFPDRMSAFVLNTDGAKAWQRIDLLQGEKTPVFQLADSINALSLSPNGRWLASQSSANGNRIDLIDATDGKIVRSLGIADKLPRFESTVFGTDKHLLAVEQSSTQVRVIAFDIESGNTLYTQEFKASEGASQQADQPIALSPLGTYYAVAHGYLVSIRRTTDGQAVEQLDLRQYATPGGSPYYQVGAMCFSDDGVELAVRYTYNSITFLVAFNVQTKSRRLDRRYPRLNLMDDLRDTTLQSLPQGRGWFLGPRFFLDGKTGSPFWQSPIIEPRARVFSLDHMVVSVAGTRKLQCVSPTNADSIAAQLSIRRSISENSPPHQPPTQVEYGDPPAMVARNVQPLKPFLRPSADFEVDRSPYDQAISNGKHLVVTKRQNAEVKANYSGPLPPLQRTTAKIWSLETQTMLQETELPHDCVVHDISQDGTMFITTRHERKIDVWAPGIKLHTSGWEHYPVDSAVFLKSNLVMTYRRGPELTALWKMPECKLHEAFAFKGVSLRDVTPDRRYAIFRVKSNGNDDLRILDLESLNWSGPLTIEPAGLLSLYDDSIQFSDDGSKFSIINAHRSNIINQPGNLETGCVRIRVYDWLSGRLQADSVFPTAGNYLVKVSYCLLDDGRVVGLYRGRSVNDVFVMDPKQRTILKLNDTATNQQNSGGGWFDIFQPPSLVDTSNLAKQKYRVVSMPYPLGSIPNVGTSVDQLLALQLGDPINLQLSNEFLPFRQTIENEVKRQGFTIGQSNATLVIEPKQAGLMLSKLRLNDGRELYYKQRGLMLNVSIPSQMDDVSTYLASELPAGIALQNWDQSVQKMQVAVPKVP